MSFQDMFDNGAMHPIDLSSPLSSVAQDMPNILPNSLLQTDDTSSKSGQNIANQIRTLPNSISRKLFINSELSEEDFLSISNDDLIVLIQQRLFEIEEGPDSVDPANEKELLKQALAELRPIEN